MAPAGVRQPNAVHAHGRNVQHPLLGPAGVWRLPLQQHRRELDQQPVVSPRGRRGAHVPQCKGECLPPTTTSASTTELPRTAAPVFVHSPDNSSQLCCFFVRAARPVRSPRLLARRFCLDASIISNLAHAYMAVAARAQPNTQWGGWIFPLFSRNDSDSRLTFACATLKKTGAIAPGGSPLYAVASPFAECPMDGSAAIVLGGWQEGRGGDIGPRYTDHRFNNS